MTVRTMRMPVALGTAIVLSLGGALMGSVAATALDVPGADAPTTGFAYDAFAQKLLIDTSVQGVAKNADGDITVMAVTGTPATTARKAAATYDNVEIEWLRAPLMPYAATDVVGGAGYIVETADSYAACSIGFSAWTPTGAPALITAGHCMNMGDGQANTRNPRMSKPSVEPAVGGSGFSLANGATTIGTFAFGQFGGKNNSPGVYGDKAESLDIAVIDAAPGVVTKPEVTDWTSAASDDLSASTTIVRSVSAPTLKKPVSKSGRTTGITTHSSVDYVNGWYNVGGHQVYGAAITGLKCAGGDSGGAVFQGTTAVGITSGGGTTASGLDLTIAADLVNGLANTGGYTIQLHIDAPTVTSPAAGSTVPAGSPITGTAPAGTTISVTPSTGTPFTTTTNNSGTWSFAAPESGSVTYSLVATKGFNTSDAVTHSVTVGAAALPAPSITPTASGTKPASVGGTGTPGATVTLDGDLAGTATVTVDGTWSIPVGVAYGTTYNFTATQSLKGATSPAASSSIAAVALPKPIVTSPADEAVLKVSPTSISGTGESDATVTLSVDGTPVAGSFPVRSGTWTAPLAAALDSGVHTLEVTQTVNSESASSTSEFEVVPAEKGTGSEEGSGDKPGSGTDKPGTEKPDTEKPDTDKPDTEKPDTEKPDTDKPDTEKPDTERPDTDKPDTDKPDTEKPDTDKPGLGNSGSGKSNTGGSGTGGISSGNNAGAQGSVVEEALTNAATDAESPGGLTTEGYNLAITGATSGLAFAGICLLVLTGGGALLMLRRRRTVEKENV